MRTEVSSEDATRLASGLVRVIRQLQAERDEAVRLAAQLLPTSMGEYSSRGDWLALGADEDPDSPDVQAVEAHVAHRLAGREGK
jgi:hypothetical protein